MTSTIASARTTSHTAYTAAMSVERQLFPFGTTHHMEVVSRACTTKLALAVAHQSWMTLQSEMSAHLCCACDSVGITWTLAKGLASVSSPPWALKQ